MTVDPASHTTIARSAVAARRKEALQLITDIRPSALKEQAWVRILAAVKKETQEAMAA